MTYIFAFVGGNEIRLKQRLGDLFHEGYLDRPVQQWQSAAARYRPATYALGAKGRTALDASGARGRARLPVQTFAHEYLSCRVLADVELCCRHSQATFSVGAALGFDTLTMSVDLPIDGRHETAIVRPDGPPFSVALATPTGTMRRCIFAGLEIDRRTEPLRPADLGRSSLARKILAYRQIVATGAYKTELGLPNLFVPIVTVNTTHLENIRTLIVELTGGRGASYMLLKSVADFADPDANQWPDLDFLDVPWKRAGYPDFSILRELREPRA